MVNIFSWSHRQIITLAIHAPLGVALFCAIGGGSALSADLTVGDAYVRGSEDGQTWTIGTRAVQMDFECRGGKFRWTSFQNRLVDPPREYVDMKTAETPFALDTPEGTHQWRLESGTTRLVSAGGRPALELDLTLTRQTLRAQMHVLAFPGTSVVREWLVIENTGPSPFVIDPQLLLLRLRSEDATSFTHYWMNGGNPTAVMGMMNRGPITAQYHRSIDTEATQKYVPWMGLQRKSDPGDGWFLALEYLGSWRLSVDHDSAGPISVVARIPPTDFKAVASGERLELPPVTIGVFHRDLDDMTVRVYDWQYQYLWDYTNADYYARPKWAVPWVISSPNLQEQFAARLAGLDMDGADLMRSTGFEMLWDDAGWSVSPVTPDGSYGSVFRLTYDGPDFSETLRYLGKMRMNWLLWFGGWPSAGLMETKVGSWGNFEWRTDAIRFPNFASDLRFREQVTRFLTAHPQCSFHTCSGGSTYSHTFDIQRYANTNYFSDFGRGPLTNYYFSYLEPPDKWTDLIEPISTSGRYARDTARQQLTMVPMWYLYPSEADLEMLRRDLELYRYLLAEGVAGRWSYAFHPVIKGDLDFFYCQRTSYDRSKACIILKHRTEGEVTILPRGLLPEHKYLVGFDSTPVTTLRTGADLMANGILIKNQAPGELIYLGLRNRPRSGQDKVAPKGPGRVFMRRETNIGHSGVALYWSPGSDDKWISYYEIQRGSKVLGKASQGNYYFDHSLGWDVGAEYSVRTVDGDGNVSGWTGAQPLADEPLIAAVLGGHFSERGREGWSAETTTDGHTFEPMRFVPPEKPTAGDMSGTPIQPGGVEGYWEGAGRARIGRGWQQASTSAACVRTWTAPRAGTVRIVGRAMKEYYRQNKGAPLRVRILHGDSPVWPKDSWTVVPLGNLSGTTHDFTLKVARGDAVRFVLDRGKSPEDDIIAWMPRIIYVGEKPANLAAGVVRIACGAGNPYRDSSGNQWSADSFYKSGKPVRTMAAIEGALPAPSDQALYQAGREGRDFTYSIPVPAGLYTVRLKFAESKYQWSSQRAMNLSINGQQVLRDFDVCQAAAGPRRAHDRVFRDLVPDAEGRLVLHFAGGFNPLQESDQATVQAIEVLPQLKPTERIDVGADAEFVDWNSFVWSADAHFTGGHVIRSNAPVSQASPTLYDQELYQTARSGQSFSYSIHVPPGLYTVHLKFAELWLKEPGQRPMNIDINGRRVRNSWDPASAAGRVGMAADIREEDVAPDEHGHIIINVSATGNNEAILQAIEIE